MRLKRSLLLAACLCGSSILSAQQGPPGCTTPSHRQFDFWVGSWSVTDSAGVTVYGTNDITSEEAGCLVHEHWAGSRGGTGQSLNYFDPRRQVWQQDWVGSGGENLHLIGHLENGAMVLEGEAPDATGAMAHHRAEWIPEPDGRVRQYWRSTTDGGHTWTIVFDGWYRKKA